MPSSDMLCYGIFYCHYGWNNVLIYEAAMYPIRTLSRQCWLTKASKGFLVHFVFLPGNLLGYQWLIFALHIDGFFSGLIPVNGAILQKRKYKQYIQVISESVLWTRTQRNIWLIWSKMLWKPDIPEISVTCDPACKAHYWRSFFWFNHNNCPELLQYVCPYLQYSAVLIFIIWTALSKSLRVLRKPFCVLQPRRLWKVTMPQSAQVSLFQVNSQASSRMMTDGSVILLILGIHVDFSTRRVD